MPWQMYDIFSRRGAKNAEKYQYNDIFPEQKYMSPLRSLRLCEKTVSIYCPGLRFTPFGLHNCPVNLRRIQPKASLIKA
jgi:hypothetical protein